MKDYYKPIYKKILIARQEFNKFADSFGSPINKLILRYTKVPKEFSFPDGRIGELYAFWIGEPLCLNEKILIEASIGCIAGSTFFVIQDQWVDEKDKPEVETTLLNNILYTKMVQSFYNITKNNNRLWTYIYKYLEEYLVSCVWELKEHHKKLKKFKEKDFYMAANRSAPIKICLSSLALAANKESIINELEDALTQILIGLQLRDDITDWEKDIQKGNFTYPISIAINKLRKKKEFSKNVNSFEKKDLEKEILISGVAEFILEESIKRFQKAKKMISHYKMHALDLYLDFTIDENKKIKEDIISKKINFFSKVYKNSPSKNLKITLYR